VIAGLLVVKNVVLGERAAVSVSYGRLEGTASVLPAAVCRREDGADRRTGRVGRPAVAVHLGVDAVQVLRNADAPPVQQELGQEVILCS